VKEVKLKASEENYQVKPPRRIRREQRSIASNFNDFKVKIETSNLTY